MLQDLGTMQRNASQQTGPARPHLAVLAGVAEVQIQISRLEGGLQQLPGRMSPAYCFCLYFCSLYGILGPPGGLAARCSCAGCRGGAIERGVGAGVLLGVLGQGGGRLQACGQDHDSICIQGHLGIGAKWSGDRGRELASWVGQGPQMEWDVRVCESAWYWGRLVWHVLASAIANPLVGC